MAIKFKNLSSADCKKEDSSSNSDSSSSSSSSSDDEENHDISLTRKRSKTDSLTGQLPVIIEDNINQAAVEHESPIKEEEKKQEVIEEYMPKRSKTSFKRDVENIAGRNSCNSNGLIEGLAVNKTIDYRYMEYLFKIIEEEEGKINEVVIGYIQKILSAFLTKKPMEVIYICMRFVYIYM